MEAISKSKKGLIKKFNKAVIDSALFVICCCAAIVVVVLVLYVGFYIFLWPSLYAVEMNWLVYSETKIFITWQGFIAIGWPAFWVLVAYQYYNDAD
jgi:hypothetical protein